MEQKPATISTPQLVIGLAVIIVGVVFTLGNLGLIHTRDYLRFWPVLIIALGLAKLVDSTGTPGRFAGVVITLVGGMLLLNNLAVVRFRIWDYWPLLLVALGISIVWQAFGRDSGITKDPGRTVSTLAVFGGINQVYETQDFRGGELTAILGGCEIDLRPARMQVDEAILQVFAFWGGIELKVPQEWTVICKGIPILGGFEQKTASPPTDNPKRLIVRGTAIMGGIEIRN